MCTGARLLRRAEARYICDRLAQRKYLRDLFFSVPLAVESGLGQCFLYLLRPPGHNVSKGKVSLYSGYGFFQAIKSLLVQSRGLCRKPHVGKISMQSDYRYKTRFGPILP